MTEVLRGDFETRSGVDLPKRGVHIYASDPSTDVWCFAYSFDDEPVDIWVKGEDIPDRVLNHIEGGGIFKAWNASFELAIWNYIMVTRYGWPVLKIEQCRCSMAAAGAMSLPLGLDKAAKALSLDIKKDAVGYKLMLRMSRPRKVTDVGEVIWWTDPERLKRLYYYCKQDVEVERSVDKKTRALKDSEQEIWELDQKINNRGVPVDMDSVVAAIRWCAKERDRLNDKMFEITEGRVRGCEDIIGLRKFSGFNSVAKSEIDKHIATAEGDILEAIQLRRDYAKTSTKKLEAFERGTMPDDRMKGIFQFYGAPSTGRWAGRRVQPQNFPRPTCSQEEIERRIEERDMGSLQGVADCLRGMIAAPKGQELICADFSSIEARVLPWMAGQEDVLEVFKNGGDLYKHAATGIYNVDYDNVTKDQRQIGKVAVLALGYGGSKGAFNSMAEGYGVEMNAKQVEGIVSSYRQANDKIVAWWFALERGAIKAMRHKGKKINVGQTVFRHTKGHLWLKLPSGRLMCFPRARVENVTKPWGTSLGIIYVGENNYSRKVEKLNTYGGKLAENIVQAIARDLLAEAMLRIEAAGYEICAHIHDEVVAIKPEGGSLKEFETLMAEQPVWAKGLPLGAEGWVGRRYRK
jgi:DNA polymerase